MMDQSRLTPSELALLQALDETRKEVDERPEGFLDGVVILSTDELGQLLRIVRRLAGDKPTGDVLTDAGREIAHAHMQEARANTAQPEPEPWTAWAYVNGGTDVLTYPVRGCRDAHRMLAADAIGVPYDKVRLSNLPPEEVRRLALLPDLADGERMATPTQYDQHTTVDEWQGEDEPEASAYRSVRQWVRQRLGR